ncbi:thioesterase domain-containing protein [Alkalimarinus alittae]|uniref:Thioesterase domain-containing protein n=1 Tax=Alkalimarinus alittae TaxID=2961619 RepID=A0ABY6MXX4_9ALTE|nr:thioesterase domain-containing protein [Alkalimarinus alittae]UZE94679.1 thioesterase domain-containing protein [Alkalimarinus alittae]
MNSDQMNDLLQTHIPLCAFMKLTVTLLTPDSIKTTAPLEPNCNMHGTGFAGAQYSLAVATGWALVHNRLDVAGAAGQLVVKEATIHYDRPVTDVMELAANIDVSMTDHELINQLAGKGKVRIPLIVNISSKGKRCGYLEASYVVVA